MSRARTCISNTIWRGHVRVRWFKVRDGCSFFVYITVWTFSGYANRYHYAGDNLDNIPFLSNFIYDILPYQHCGVYPLQDVDTNVTGCDVFYARRPPNSCLNYLPPVVGKLWRKSSNSDVDKKRTPISDLKPSNTNMTTSYGVGNTGPGLWHGHKFSLLCSMLINFIFQRIKCLYK
jgi:hypothetical protein